MSNVKDSLLSIGGTLTGLGSVIDLFGGKSQAELDAIDKQNRNKFIRDQINVYGLADKQQYINPDVINDLMYGQGIWQAKTQRYFNSVSLALKGSQAVGIDAGSDYNIEARNYIAKIDAQMKNSSPYYGLNTDPTNGQTYIGSNKSALSNRQIVAGVQNWIWILLIAGVAVTYIYTKK